MSNGGPRGARLEIIERPSTSIVAIRLAGNALAGTEVVIAGTGPGVGVRWLIHNIGTTVRFGSTPAGGDNAVALAELFRAAVAYELFGVSLHNVHTTGVGVSRPGSGMGTLIRIDNPDILQLRVEALTSTVNVSGTASFVGVQYTAL